MLNNLLAEEDHEINEFLFRRRASLGYLAHQPHAITVFL